MKPFDLHVLTMNKPFFEGKCSSLVVPIKSGQYGILADHCNWVSVIVPGEMKLTVEGGDGKQMQKSERNALPKNFQKICTQPLAMIARHCRAALCSKRLRVLRRFDKIAKNMRSNS